MWIPQIGILRLVLFGLHKHDNNSHIDIGIHAYNDDDEHEYDHDHDRYVQKCDKYVA